MKIERRNYTMDSICEEIGFTATSVLMEWRGGANLCVPSKACRTHFLSHLLGFKALEKLVAAYGGQTLWIPARPTGQHGSADDRLRKAARLFAAGKGMCEVATTLKISQRHAQRMRLALEERGLLPGVMPG